MSRMNIGLQIIVTCMTISALSTHAAANLAKTSYVVSSTVKPQISADKSKPTSDLATAKLILMGDGASKNLKSESPQGPRSGGGGNSCALNISENTKQLLKTFDLMPQLMTKKKLNEVKNRISKTAFYLKDGLYKDGESKDAINFPAENKIYVSPNLCKWQLVEVSGSAMAILLHEYLGLAGFDDSKYQVSGKFLTKYAELVAVTPILKNSNVDEKLYRAVVYKFLSEANNSESKLAKIISSLNEDGEDGRNADGPISKKITTDDIQIIVTSSLDLGNLWDSAERRKDFCIATSASAEYLIYLSSISEIHSGSELSTIKFTVSSKRNFYAKVRSKDQTYCGELPEDAKKFSDPVEKIEVTDFQLAE